MADQIKLGEKQRAATTFLCLTEFRPDRQKEYDKHYIHPLPAPHPSPLPTPNSPISPDNKQECHLPTPAPSPSKLSRRVTYDPTHQTIYSGVRPPARDLRFLKGLVRRSRDAGEALGVSSTLVLQGTDNDVGAAGVFRDVAFWIGPEDEQVEETTLAHEKRIERIMIKLGLEEWLVAATPILFPCRYPERLQELLSYQPALDDVDSKRPLGNLIAFSRKLTDTYEVLLGEGERTNGFVPQFLIGKYGDNWCGMVCIRHEMGPSMLGRRLSQKKTTKKKSVPKSISQSVTTKTDHGRQWWSSYPSVIFVLIICLCIAFLNQ